MDNERGPLARLGSSPWTGQFSPSWAFLRVLRLFESLNAPILQFLNLPNSFVDKRLGLCLFEFPNHKIDFDPDPDSDFDGAIPRPPSPASCPHPLRVPQYLNSPIPQSSQSLHSVPTRAFRGQFLFLWHRKKIAAYLSVRKRLNVLQLFCH